VTAAGIPVATFTDNSKGTDYLAFAGIEDFYSHGLQLGELLAEKMEYKGQVAMLIGTLSATPHILRTQGIKDALAKYPDIEIVSEQADNDSLEEAVTLTEQLMNTYPDLKAITSSDGSAAAGASIAVKDTDKAGKLIIVGFDAIDETIEGLKNGTIFASLSHDTYAIGQYIVPMMVDIADGKINETQSMGGCDRTDAGQSGGIRLLSPSFRNHC
jgi:ribose transport system substrate-binding protein